MSWASRFLGMDPNDSSTPAHFVSAPDYYGDLRGDLSSALRRALGLDSTTSGDLEPISTHYDLSGKPYRGAPPSAGTFNQNGVQYYPAMDQSTWPTGWKPPASYFQAFQPPTLSLGDFFSRQYQTRFGQPSADTFFLSGLQTPIAAPILAPSPFQNRPQVPLPGFTPFAVPGSYTTPTVAPAPTALAGLQRTVEANSFQPDFAQNIEPIAALGRIQAFTPETQALSTYLGLAQAQAQRPFGELSAADQRLLAEQISRGREAYTARGINLSPAAGALEAQGVERFLQDASQREFERQQAALSQFGQATQQAQQAQALRLQQAQIEAQVEGQRQALNLERKRLGAAVAGETETQRTQRFAALGDVEAKLAALEQQRQQAIMDAQQRQTAMLQQAQVAQGGLQLQQRQQDLTRLFQGEQQAQAAAQSQAELQAQANAQNLQRMFQGGQLYQTGQAQQAEQALRAALGFRAQDIQQQQMAQQQQQFITEMILKAMGLAVPEGALAPAIAAPANPLDAIISNVATSWLSRPGTQQRI